MAESIFCCSSVRPYRPTRLDHDEKFRELLAWNVSSEKIDRAAKEEDNDDNEDGDLKKPASTNVWPFVIQVVRQINYGPLESKRYFARRGDTVDQQSTFDEVEESDLIDANFQNVNSYKNFKCQAHGRFFELNLYQKDPYNKHHWRANIARPSVDIDVSAKQEKEKSGPINVPDKRTEASKEIDVIPDGLKDAADPQKSKEGNSDSSRISTAEEAEQPKISTISQALREALDMSSEDEDTYDHMDRYNSWDSDREENEAKDYTACSADSCGYCGNCDY